MIIGYSGCTIDFQDKIVIKSTANKYPKNRLIAQAKKQEYFYNLGHFSFNIPKIYEYKETDNNFAFSMEYFNNIDLIQYFDTFDIKSIDYFWYTVKSFINTNLSKSKYAAIDRSIILDKYNKVKPYNNFDKVFYKLPIQIKIPIGPCHGDLTLSNILFNGTDFVLIDFLDSFVESPLIDIAKIRQDTKYHWSLKLYKYDYDKFRIDRILEYLDKKIIKEYNQEYLWHLEILGLMRILPYCTNENIKRFILGNLDDELDSPNLW